MSHIYQLPKTIDHQNVEIVVFEVEQIINQLPLGSSITINCQELTTFDSSALSAILSIKRRAEKVAVNVHLHQVPEKLASLAKVYDLADIVLS